MPSDKIIQSEEKEKDENGAEASASLLLIAPKEAAKEIRTLTEEDLKLLFEKCSSYKPNSSSSFSSSASRDKVQLR